MTFGDPRLPERFWRKVKMGTPPEHRPDLGPCWIWTGASTKGHGMIAVAGRRPYAHRYAYQILVGDIPEGRELDHLCRVRQCVNPTHLEPVTSQINTLRGAGKGGALYSYITHCRHGHELVEANIYWERQGKYLNRKCRTCRSNRMAEFKARNTI